MPAQYVKAYIKRNKNDAADAEAICERLYGRRCASCQAKRLKSKLPCCCTEVGSG